MSKKRNHIKKAGHAITGGLATFLVVGLTGCEDKDPSCRDLRYAPQWKIEECQKNYTNRQTSSSWIPIYSNSSNSHAGTTGYIPSANKLPSTDAPSSSTKSGFFKSSSGSSSSSIGG